MRTRNRRVRDCRAACSISVCVLTHGVVVGAALDGVSGGGGVSGMAGGWQCSDCRTAARHGKRKMPRGR